MRLALASEVHRLAENARRFLRRMEAGRVFRLDEVEIELRPALQIKRGLEIGVGPASGPGSLEVVDQPDQGGHRFLTQVPVPVLNLINSL